MKKLLPLLSIAFCIAVITPSCSSDETFEEIVLDSNLDQTAPTNGDDTEPTPIPPGGGG
ncbi:MAG: hypothetical protein JXR03_16310 [Cyclobacteriaceae bacterium]